MHDLWGYRLLQEPHEHIGDDGARSTLRAGYGLSGFLTDRVSTERDDTFFVRQPADAVPRFVLKFEHPAEEYDVILGRARMLRRLESKASIIPAARLMPCLDGDLLARCDDGGTTRWASLTTFVRGTIVSERPQTCSSALLGDIGAQLARIQMVLAGQTLPSDRLGRVLWDVRLLPDIAEDVLPMIDDRVLKASVGQAVADFRQVEASVASMPQTLCHGDFHPGNLIVDQRTPDTLAGIIDFGDMHMMPQICDLGTCLTYLVNARRYPDNPLEACRAALRGYMSVYTTFDAGQLALLPWIMEARSALVLLLPVITERMSGVDPSHYQSDADSRLARLRLLQELGPERVLAMMGVGAASHPPVEPGGFHPFSVPNNQPHEGQATS